MKSFASIVILSAALVGLLPSALAHGYVREVKVGDKKYTGVNPSSGKTSGVVRRINHPNPNHLRDTTAIPCGPGANTRAAASFVPVKPGQKVSLTWDGGSGHSRWPHELGPLVNYIAKCNVKGCKDDASKLKFFKFNQQGLLANQDKKSNGGSWFQKALMTGPSTLTIPTGLANGEYILRHEIIALHEGNNPKMGPEFYPSCINILVSGGAATFSPTGAGVTFPAAYRSDTPGNKGLTKTIFRNWKGNVSSYIFPGPAISTFGGKKTRRNRHAGVARLATADETEDPEIVERSEIADEEDIVVDSAEVVERSEIAEEASS